MDDAPSTGFFSSPAGDGALASGQGREIEIKLVGAPRVLAAVYARLGGTPDRPRRLASSYHDTPDGHLWRRGFTLRLRRSGADHELTLKTGNGQSIARGEWTTRLEAPVVDLGKLPAEAPRGEIGTVLAEELAVRFTTAILRRTSIVETGGARIEVALDAGRVNAARRSVEISEIELELLSGEPRAMLVAARDAIGRARVTVSLTSKARRGMDLAAGVAPAGVKGTRVRIGRGDTIGDALAKIIGSAAGQAIANLPAAADGSDAEGVHQLRVALRRFRSALATFGDALNSEAEPLATRSAAALAILGPARDLDVFLAETLARIAARPGGARATAALARAASARRTQAYRQVRRLVDDPDMSRFLIDLLMLSMDCTPILKAPGRPLGEIAAPVLARRHARVLKAGRGFARLDAEARHDVRIAVKKLRYACDFLTDLFPGKATRAYLERLADLQDALGRFNDAALAGDIAGQIVGTSQAARRGADHVAAWYDGYVAAGESDLTGAFTRFKSAPAFWAD